MPSIFRTAAAAFTLLTLVSAAPPVGEMEKLLQKRAGSYDGCYSSSTPLESKGDWMYQSSGYCSGQCSGSAVFAMSGSKECWCGDQLPPVADKVDDTSCNQPCVGFPDDTCGGNGFYSVYTTGGTVDHYGGDSSSSSSSAVSMPKSTPTSEPPTVVTSMTGGQTVVVTVPASARATASETSKASGGGGPNTAGIAAGVVVGVVAIAGMALGGYFFMRHKRRREAEEDFKQRTHVDNMMRAGSERKPPGTSYSGMSDQRLDPEAGRRNSVGSLADNQDYSRRILRVANPSD
ncbi:WSC domain containing protein [Zymoseptoria brevis]|uniref:WSC domain containing protein n=1 Tax=Zymoseptoria brevis TaxID=1047168 RepID=A0A0F4GXQ8_9PEZI|nr:WSC domain containing protein [Zymoseptoria brevis]